MLLIINRTGSPVKYNDPMNHPPAYRAALLQALLVTFLWSTSWVLIKIGLADIPALTFAGLRYSLAFLCLLPFALRPKVRQSMRTLTVRQWLLLVCQGLLYYAIVQGAQFLSLAYLPAATVSLMLNFTTLVVAGMGILWLNERPGKFGWAGILITLVGALVFFYPFQGLDGQVSGLVIALIGTLANAGAAVLGRYINHHHQIPPILVTTISMGIGGGLLLAGGAGLQGLPSLDRQGWALVLWLAMVNTAFAFTLWNHTLRTLSAMDSTLINNTMLVQIALLAWIFLGESLSLHEIWGMALAGLGTLVVQLRPRP
jgi:drug/metabolite transporter (DMT)-like permease